MYSPRSFLRSQSHYSHSFLRDPLNCCEFCRTVAFTFVHSMRRQQLLTKWPLDYCAMFKTPWPCPSPLFLVFELASCRSPIRSWLRATHRSEVGYVLLQITLCWRCVTKVALDCVVLGFSGDKDLVIILLRLGMSSSRFRISLSLSHFCIIVIVIGTTSQLDPSFLIPVCICIDSS